MFVDNFGFWLVVIVLVGVGLYLFSWILLWLVNRNIRSARTVRLQIYRSDLEHAKKDMQELNERLDVLKRANACSEACLEGQLKTTAAIEMLEYALHTAATTGRDEDLTPSLDTLHRGIWRLLALLQLSVAIATENLKDADADDDDNDSDDAGGADDIAEYKRSSAGDV